MIDIKNPLISVVITTYNTKLLTLECLEKLHKSALYLGDPVEIILVDNGTDDTGIAATKKFPNIKLIDPKENTGFARGNNLGIKAASKNTKYFLLLNSDALVKKETLRMGVSFMKTEKSCDVLGCRLVFRNGKLQPSAGYLPTPWRIFNWSFGIDLIPGLNRILKPFHPNYSGFFKKDREVGWVTGAFVLLKSEVIQVTHGFDENYFMYGEEVEWFRRINDKGFRVWFTPKFEIIHLVATSSGSTRNAFLREVEGIYYFSNKYYPNVLPLIKTVVKVGMFLRFLSFRVIGNKYRTEIHKEAFKIK